MNSITAKKAKLPLNVILAIRDLSNHSISKIIESHAGTVVPECFKDDNASQWKSGKFDPRSLTNP